jgi:hypothetical protein
MEKNNILYVVCKYEQNNVFFLGTMNKNNAEGKHDDCMNHGNRKHMFDMPLTESGSGILSEQNWKNRNATPAEIGKLEKKNLKTGKSYPFPHIFLHGILQMLFIYCSLHAL